ncbi:hypothetical protein GCM10011613_02400 [Cellvibrio zantedeschiae]|uniref:Uncharacterized protein n=1 Tax=Cellvibrio zantedeschiae TaxID=1237077 RepID=A0ABQ3AQ05_9GAMM|nr:DUF6445 family protein [Cellvibrio zantedeschiae]GGY62432.1 hypothetical protein GCM10011613_02400 [Cellvibrio zantedeschiae]
MQQLAQPELASSYLNHDSNNPTYDFSINPDLTLEVIYVGHEQEPVIVVDNLLKLPDSLIQYAESGHAFQKDVKDFYPGIRKPLSPTYAENVYSHLMETMWMVFSSRLTVNIKLLSSVLSLATSSAKDLRPIQSVPHFDSFVTNNIASVHYLCDSKFGGTSFYRHRTTGFETMNAQRLQQYAPLLKSEVMQSHKTSFDYINGDNELFARTASIDAKFNRAIFYRSNILHSANIQNAAELNNDPRTGRLTANTLIMIE